MKNKDRFKFKAWSSEGKKMYDVSSLNFSEKQKEGDPEHTVCILYDIYTKPFRSSIDDVKVMQCTGFKDKNGKLIYEGHVVYIGDHWCKKWKNSLKEVTWQSQLFDNSDWAMDPECLEIRGNIYENPELLEPDKKDK